MADQKVAIVTGISSGIGRAAAGELARRGFRVFGTVRSHPVDAPDGVEPITLDVRDESSIDGAVAEVLARAGRIDALINNAGSTIVGAIEETDTRQAQELFDVNFFGAVRMTRAVLPSMRAQRSGRIVFVSSVVGFVPAPFMGFYSASKHALEGYSQSLDHEVRGLGIRAILVEPGFTKTYIDKNSSRAAHPLADYANAREKAAAGINASVEKGDDPMVVARTIGDAIEAARPRLRHQAGKRAGVLAKLRGVMPESIFDRSLRRQFHLDG